MNDNLEDFNCIIECCFSNLGLSKIEDNNLKYKKDYFIDNEHKKYLIYTYLFENRDDLIENWDMIQSEDMAFYLQGIKYANQDIRWDCYYLLFYTGEAMQADEVCKIERDLFCCKKLVVNFNKDSDLKALVNQKLPITQEYYPKFANDMVTENTLFDSIRSEIGISKDILSNEILSNIYINKDNIENIFCNYEVNIK